MDNSGEPLSIGETLKNLAVVAEELQNSGFLQGAEVDSVSAVNPSEYLEVLCIGYQERILCIYDNHGMIDNTVIFIAQTPQLK